MLPLIDKMGNTDMGSNSVFSRKPFRSGSSQVITVTGVPGISDEKELFFKEVEIEDRTAMLMVSYDEISKHELEQINKLSVISE